LKISANVKIAMQYFENFGERQMPPLFARLNKTVFLGTCSDSEP